MMTTSSAQTTGAPAQAAIAQRPLREGGWTLPADDLETSRLMRAYASDGGIASGDEVARLMRSHHDQATSLLARWIFTRRIVHFAVHGEIMVPLFQFAPDDMSLRTGVVNAVALLSRVMNDRMIAQWFIDRASPGDAVRPEARTMSDRYSARGRLR